MHNADDWDKQSTPLDHINYLWELNIYIHIPHSSLFNYYLLKNCRSQVFCPRHHHNKQYEWIKKEFGTCSNCLTCGATGSISRSSNKYKKFIVHQPAKRLEICKKQRQRQLSRFFEMTDSILKKQFIGH